MIWAHPFQSSGSQVKRKNYNSDTINEGIWTAHVLVGVYEKEWVLRKHNIKSVLA